MSECGPKDVTRLLPSGYQNMITVLIMSYDNTHVSKEQILTSKSKQGREESIRMGMCIDLLHMRQNC